MTRKERKRRALLLKFRPRVPNIYAVKGFTPNGCGPAGWLSWFVPDSFPWLGSFTVACDYHDFLYYIGGDEAARQHADLELGRMMTWLVRRRSWLTRWRMARIARVYYGAVRTCGKKRFNYRTGL